MVRATTASLQVRVWHFIPLQRCGGVSSGSRAYLIGMTITPNHSGLERLLTVSELSDYLGIPVATLYDWRVDGVGPQAVKLGRSLRYPESCVRAWIEEKLRG
jgi:excisionase family DNA binding protein